VTSVGSNADSARSRLYPLDVLGAQAQGMVGYLFAQALRNAVQSRTFAALICQTVVDLEDLALAHPLSFVGPVYGETRAQELSQELNWDMQPDGSGWRRVVPSLMPRDLVELSVIRSLLDDGVAVICAGGGIPVIRDELDGLRGIEAVIDKDHTASLLAVLIGADALLLVTDVAAVAVDDGAPSARELRETSVEELRRLKFPTGSMGPKIEAACDYVHATGRTAAIGRLEDAEAMLLGSKGTVVRGTASA